MEEDSDNDDATVTPAFLINWSKHGESLRNIMYQFFLEKKYVDISIECAGAEIEFHYFHASAYSRVLKEKLDQGIKSIKIDDIDLETLKLLIELIYKGSVTIEPQNVPKLLEAAEKLQVDLVKYTNSDEILKKADVHSVTSNSDNTLDNLQTNLVTIYTKEKEIDEHCTSPNEEVQELTSQMAQDSSTFAEVLQRSSNQSSNDSPTNTVVAASIQGANALADQRKDINNLTDEDFSILDDVNFNLLDNVTNEDMTLSIDPTILEEDSAIFFQEIFDLGELSIPEEGRFDVNE